MKVGLVRHFRVELKRQRFWFTGEQFNQWVLEYEEAPVQLTGYKVNAKQWDRCVCSEQARAVHTARHMYSKEIVYTGQLWEVGLAAPQFGRFSLPWMRLPLQGWLVLGRRNYICMNKRNEQLPTEGGVYILWLQLKKSGLNRWKR